MFQKPKTLRAEKISLAVPGWISVVCTAYCSQQNSELDLFMVGGVDNKNVACAKNVH
jgi:hypothetical protein